MKIHPLIDKAIVIAHDKHKNQLYGKLPYIKHLSDVGIMIESFYRDEIDLIVAGYLHDILEDTDYTLGEVRECFGDVVADIVWRVTDEGGGDRAWRKNYVYSKIHGHRGATIVKICDRICNTLCSMEERSSPHYLVMYKNEYRKFFENLYVSGMCDELWNYLDNIMKEV